MNSEDQFEKKLQSQTVRSLPGSWRQEILAAARAESASAKAAGRSGLSFSEISGVTRFLANFFWPNPKAWGGLAALWVVILGLHLANRETPQTRVARREPPPSPLVRELLQQQERLFAELVGPIEKNEANQPPKRIAPGPRSERQTQRQFSS